MVEKNTKERLIDKSIEAFILGLEIYNKPTIRYRIEGFSFFIINAWELMLKAEMINRNISLFYKDKPDRSLSFDACLQKIYPDKNTRTRINLEKIEDLRNMSTHFITEEYELKYAPLFQACALNYVNELRRFHKVEIEKFLPQNFLTVTARLEPLNNEEIRLKYPPEIAEKFIQKANEIDVLSEAYNSEKFAINIRQNLYITKRKDDADFTVRVDKNSKNNTSIIKDLKDPSNTHKYSYTSAIVAVQERLKKGNITIDYKKGFNSYVLNLIMNFYDVKSNKDFSYKHVIGNSESYTYSQKFVDFIVEEIKKNPHNFVESLAKAKK